MSLYRKYRPQKFGDLIGQDHIRQTIMNALERGTFSHAYIFAGARGLGKTTLARLLSKTLNCQGRKLGKDLIEPCNKCFSCREIIKGNNLDMIEIDAASNRGIDEIRELRDKIRFAPSGNRYKIYIIDECHMLTREAFNALLKTLEEPPAHAIFILATTELHKVPATIISRAQVFEFKRATIQDIYKLLVKITKTEGMKIDDEALHLLARLSTGSFRDALSMLDQVSSLGTDGRHTISLEEVQVLLGQTTQKAVWEFADLIIKGKQKELLQLIDGLYNEGKDLENFVGEIISLFRTLLLKKMGLSLKYEFSKDEEDKLNALSQEIENQTLIKIIEKLSAVRSQVKTSVLGQLPLEMAILEISQSQEVKPTDKPADKFVEPPIIGTFSLELWEKVVREIKAHNNAIAAMVKNTQFYKTTDHQIILAVKFKFHAEQICNKKNLTVIEGAVQKVTGVVYKVDCIVNKNLELKKPKDSEEEILDEAKEVFEVDD